MGAVARMGERRRIGEVIVLRRRAELVHQRRRLRRPIEGRQGRITLERMVRRGAELRRRREVVLGRRELACVQRHGLVLLCHPQGAPKSCGIGGGGCMAKSPGNAALWCICWRGGGGPAWASSCAMPAACG